MSALPRSRAGRLLKGRVEAEAYVASVCFKHGPPTLLGTELEWTVHHEHDPTLPLDPDDLAAALGPHSTRTLRPDGRQRPLPAGSPVTIEPGGQVEISALPQPTLGGLLDTVLADQRYLAGLLADAGLALGDAGLDPHRPPRRILQTPRYAAMERAFAPLGDHGITMMGATAGLQVCVDAGDPASLPLRWAAATALGPPLVAAFANSGVLAGDDTGWASARMRAVLGTDPDRTLPLPYDVDPVSAWVRRAMDTRVLCIQGPGDCWDAPPGLTFGDWADGRGDVSRGPTVDDLDYHLSTQFPPVRPRGYLEIRYIDAQPGTRWTVPVALLAALFAEDRITEAALEACAPVADKWYQAAERGLGDRAIARAACAVLDLGVEALPTLGLTAEREALIGAELDRIRLATLGRDASS